MLEVAEPQYVCPAFLRCEAKMRARTLIAVATIAALPVTSTFAGDTIIAGNQNCARPAASETDKGNVAVHYLVSAGWIMGWLSAENRRTRKADWLANVRPEHVTELIDKYCQGSATVEEAGLNVLAQLRIEYVDHLEHKRRTGKDALQD